MAQITWRNVEAPNFSGALEGYRQFANMFGAGTQGISDALGAYRKDQNSQQDAAIMADALKLRTAPAIDAALQDGSLLNGRTPTAAASARLFENASALVRDDTGRIDNTKSVAAFDRSQRDLSAMDALRPYAARIAAAQGNPDALRQIMSEAQPALAQAPANAGFDLLTAARGAEAGRNQNTVSGVQTTGVVRNDADTQSAQALITEATRRGANLDPTTALAFAESTPMSPGARQLFMAAFPAAYGGSVGGVPGVGGSNGGLNPGAAATAAMGGAPAMGGTSRADRNANPGNLKAPEGTWVRSAPGFQGVDEGGFAKFDTPANGMAAMATQLNRYREGTAATGGKATKTVSGIIGTWSPENDPKNAPGSTNAYTNYVANKLGLKPGDEVPADKMPAMAQAMYEFESGNKGTPSGAASATTPAAQPAVDPFTARANVQQLQDLQAQASVGSIAERGMQDNAGSVASKYVSAAQRIDADAGTVADELRDGPFKGTSRQFLLGQINKIVQDGKVNPALAGEIMRQNIVAADRGPSTALSAYNPARAAETVTAAIRRLTPGTTVNLGNGQRLNDDGIKATIEQLRSENSPILQQALANTQRQAKIAQVNTAKENVQKAQDAVTMWSQRVNIQPGARDSLQRAQAALAQATSAFNAVRAETVIDPNYNPTGRKAPVSVSTPESAEAQMSRGIMGNW